MSTESFPHPLPAAGASRTRPLTSRIGARLLARPELLGLLGLTAILNLWNLGINGWANTYYSAAVRSMSTSWHDFLFASLDKTGLMTVDKPPLSLWVEALSVRVFGFHPLSILIPEALMGIAAVALLYDLVARRFGRVAGFVGGLAFAVTPMTVAVARHNNPDELLILCCVAAVWAAARGLENGRTRWLVLSGVLVGLGFETKMGVALLIVPGIAVAWLWSARGSVWAPNQAAARGRRGDDRRGGGVAAAGDAHAGVRPAVDLRHVGQQHLVADLRLQRSRPRLRPVGRARRRLRRDDVRRSDRRRSACSRRGSVTRPVGCWDSRSSPASRCSC